MKNAASKGGSTAGSVYTVVTNKKNVNTSNKGEVVPQFRVVGPAELKKGANGGQSSSVYGPQKKGNNTTQNNSANGSKKKSGGTAKNKDNSYKVKTTGEKREDEKISKDIFSLFVENFGPLKKFVVDAVEPKKKMFDGIVSTVQTVKEAYNAKKESDKLFAEENEIVDFTVRMSESGRAFNELSAAEQEKCLRGIDILNDVENRIKQTDKDYAELDKMSDDELNRLLTEKINGTKIGSYSDRAVAGYIAQKIIEIQNNRFEKGKEEKLYEALGGDSAREKLIEHYNISSMTKAEFIDYHKNEYDLMRLNNPSLPEFGSYEYFVNRGKELETAYGIREDDLLWKDQSDARRIAGELKKNYYYFFDMQIDKLKISDEEKKEKKAAAHENPELYKDYLSERAYKLAEADTENASNRARRLYRTESGIEKMEANALAMDYFGADGVHLKNGATLETATADDIDFDSGKKEAQAEKDIWKAIEDARYAQSGHLQVYADAGLLGEEKLNDYEVFRTAEKYVGSADSKIDAYDYAEEHKDNKYGNDLGGVFGLNYRLGDIGVKQNEAGAVARDLRSDDVEAADVYDILQRTLIGNNKETYNTDDMWWKSSVAAVAQTAPQMIGQTKEYAKGYVLGAGVTAGVTYAMTGKVNIALAHKVGDAAGDMSTAAYMFRQTAGGAYYRELKNGLSIDDAYAISTNEAALSAAIEYGMGRLVSGVGGKVVGKISNETGEVMAGSLVKKLLKSGMSEKGAKVVVRAADFVAGNLGEGAEEWLQEGASITAERIAKDGRKVSLLEYAVETLDLSNYSSEEFERMNDSFKAGFVVGTFHSTARVGLDAGITGVSTALSKKDSKSVRTAYKMLKGLDEEEFGKTILAGEDAESIVNKAIVHGRISKNADTVALANSIYNKMQNGEKVSASDVGKLSKQLLLQGDNFLAEKNADDVYYLIEHDDNNVPFVVVENDVLDGLDTKQKETKVKEVLKERFSRGVHVGNELIRVNRMTRNEVINSKYSQALKRSNPELYDAKLNTLTESEDVLKASRNYVNEGLKHTRKDNVIDFARGTVNVRIGGKDYKAEIVVGTTSGNNLVLYDVVGLESTIIKDKKTKSSSRVGVVTDMSLHQQSAKNSREAQSHSGSKASQNKSAGGASASNKSIPQNSKNSNKNVSDMDKIIAMGTNEYAESARAKIETTESGENSNNSTEVSRARDYSYQALTAKPDMKITVVDNNIPDNRIDIVAAAKKNAAKVGTVNEKNNTASVFVDDIGKHVVLGTKGLQHGLRRLKKLQTDANSFVTLKAGEIIKNSIRINELTPKNENSDSSYVLIGAAKNIDGDLYIVESVINQFSNELMSMDVLYSINTKKENLLRSMRPGFLRPITGSTISIAELLGYVNEYFPDILPEEILKYYGHTQRPAGKVGESALFSVSDVSGGGVSGVTLADIISGNIPEALRVRLESFKKVISRLGFTVVYESHRETPKNTIGYVDFTNREVYLSPEHIDEALLTHELTHIIDKGFSGKYVKSLTSFFKNHLSDEWNKKFEEVKAKYEDIAKKNEGFTYTDSTLLAETLAEMCTEFTTEEYIKKAANMEVGTIKQIGVLLKYAGAKLESIFGDNSNAQKFKVASLKWQLALNRATKTGANNSGSGVAFSIKEIKGDSGTSYGAGVFLDSNLLTGLTENERKQMVKEYVVAELAGEHLLAYDNHGDPIDVRIARRDEYFKNEKGKRRQVVKELYNKNSRNKVKQEAIVLVDELISVAEFDKKTPAKHRHDWLDNNGKNDWDIWEVYIQEKNKTVWKATLNVANTQNGEKILYDIDPIKMVEQASKSATSTTNYSISDIGENVNKKFSAVSNEDLLGMFVGEKANIGKKRPLKQAMEMEKAGKTAEEIWRVTNWSRGLDGNWKYEIDDSKAVFLFGEVIESNNAGAKLSEYLQHDELYKAYPFLKNLYVVWDHNTSRYGKKGTYYSYPNRPSWRHIEINAKISFEEKKSALLHEIQHAIQDYEGFASGASAQYWANQTVYDGTELGRARDRFNGARKKLSELEGGSVYLSRAERYYEMCREETIDADINYDSAKAQIRDFMRKEGVEELFDEYVGSKNAFMHYVQSEPSVYNAYENTAGEIEARAVEQRRNLTEKERKELFPEEFIAADDVRFVEEMSDATNEANSEEELSQDKKYKKRSLTSVGNDNALSFTPEATTGTDFVDSQNAENINKNISQKVKELEESISLISEALENEELSRTDRVALITERTKHRKRLAEIKGDTDEGKVSRRKAVLDEYNETGDPAVLPSEERLKASDRYDKKRIAEIRQEFAQIQEALRNDKTMTTYDREELISRKEALTAQLQQIADNNSVLSEIKDIVDGFGTGEHISHEWVNEASPDLSDPTVGGMVRQGVYNTNDVERNFKRFFGKHYGEAYDKVLKPFYESKKAYAEDVVKYAKLIREEVVKKLGIKEGTKESAAVMWLGEGERPLTQKELVADLGKVGARRLRKQIKKGEVSERFTEYAYEDCVKEFGREKADNIFAATKVFRKCYDELIAEINKVRAEIYPNNPDKLIKKRADYFRHFNEISSSIKGLRAAMENNQGIDPMLVGLSEHTEPKSKWQSWEQKRTGNKTTYDAVGGFLDYLMSAEYAIHIDKNIVNFRSLARDLALAKSEEAAGAGNPNANGFIRYLQRFANHLAGKTVSTLDRAIADMPHGRQMLAVLNWFNNRAKANAVLGNMSSVVAQVSNIKNAVGKIDKTRYLWKGAAQTFGGMFGKDNKIQRRYNESGFLKERFMGDELKGFETNWKKVWHSPKNFAAWILGLADEVGTRITYNAAYNQAKARKLSNPAEYADSFTRSCVAGRGIGDVPLVLQSQVAKLFMPFRVEVLNDMNARADMLWGRDYWQKQDKGKKAKSKKVEENSISKDSSLVNKMQDIIDEIKKAPEIFDVTADVLEPYKSFEKKSDRIYEYFKSLGGSVVHPELGKIELNKSGAKATINHGFGDRKLLAVGAIKNILEKGRIVEHQENWKGKGFDTYVIVGRGNIVEGKRSVPCSVGVIVKAYPGGDFNSKFYLHEVVEIKNEKGYPSAMAADNGVTHGGNPSLETIISQEEGKIKDDVSGKTDDFDRIVSMGSQAGDGKLKLHKRIWRYTRFLVFCSVMNALIAALKGDGFSPIDDIEEGFEEAEEEGKEGIDKVLAGIGNSAGNLWADYADGYGDGVAYDPLGDIAQGIYEGLQEGESVGGDIGYSVMRSFQNLFGDYLSNNPFSQVAITATGADEDVLDKVTNGKLYTPAGGGSPVFSTLWTTAKELADGDYATAGKEVFTDFVMPWGGSQLDKSIRGAYEYGTGYATTENAYERMVGKGGKLKYLIKPNQENFVKSLLFGPASFGEANDYYYTEDKYKLDEEDTAEVVAEKGYGARKTKFDEIISWKRYNDELEQMIAERAKDYYAGDTESSMYSISWYTDEKGEKKLWQNAVPYGRFNSGISITVDKRKVTGEIDLDTAKEMNIALGERLEGWYDKLNDSAEFARLDEESKKEIVSSIFNIEKDYMVVQELHSQGLVTEYEFNNACVDYIERCAEKLTDIDASVMAEETENAQEERVNDRENADAFVRYNAAAAGQYFLDDAYFIDDEVKAEVERYYQYESSRPADDVDVELMRLSNATRSDIRVYGNPYGIISYTKRGVDYAIKIPSSEVYNLFEVADTQVRRNLSSLFKKNSYINASDEDKKEMVASVRKKVRARIKEKYKAMYPSIKIKDPFDRIVEMKSK